MDHHFQYYQITIVIYFLIRSSESCFQAADSCYNARLAIKTLGRVAQSVEQRIENPRVTGSIPVPATNKIKLTEMWVFLFLILVSKLNI